MAEKLSFELSVPGRKGFELPALDVPEKTRSSLIPEKYLRKSTARLPELTEPEVMRHFISLSTLNHHVDIGFYPLGSCTMKYNPKINENTARIPGFSQIHPLQDADTVQGALELMHDLGTYLATISGMKAVTLQPAAGAQGELAGLMMIRAYHEDQGNPRKYILIPDSAHGTNPASVTISGYQPLKIRSNEAGLVDLEDLKAHLSDEVAGIMLTNPNTLGLFEVEIKEILEAVHAAGALAYMDGANLNALLGIVRPGDLGFDVMHFNLHKTFSTPHGGGGPGSGPVGVNEKLVDFLPIPVPIKKDNQFLLDFDRPKSIGKVTSLYGNFGVMVRAYTYIRRLGAKGLRQVSENAIINANYLLQLLKDIYEVGYPGQPMHEFILSASKQKKQGAKALDIAKRMLDYGVHAPTIYFPLIVPEAMMIEPTETESRQTLDAFAEIMRTIAQEIETNPDLLHAAPVTTPVSRLDEVKAVKDTNFSFFSHN
ncbi:aminomethyl-transferring glycine dehydrogenase subunit GcvPB [bacterium]|nr:aminomethyl-transferring glycine dehydrogenase subunit GcvPB [bacterium]